MKFSQFLLKNWRILNWFKIQTIKIKFMKTLKYILSTVLLITMVWSCTDDEFGNTDFISSAVAPTNVAALVTITQDNTGLVTIAPTADGAVLFDVNYGDGTTELAKVNAGKVTTHNYEEGNYTVNIAAKGITGLKTEITHDLVVSFQAPEFGTDPIIENDAAVSKKVNVTVPDDGSFAMFFDVTFVEEGVETIVSANVGETASHIYANAGLVDIKVVLKGGAIETTEFLLEGFEVTEILAPITSALTPPSRNEVDYISIYGDKYTNVAGTDYNPDWGQSSQGSGFAEFDLNGDKMLQYTNLSYQGISIGETIDVSEMEYLHMDVWTAGLTVFETSLINGVDGDSTEKPVSRDLTVDKWTSIDIPIAEYTDQGLTVDQIFQLKFVGTPWATSAAFVDNIYFWREESVVVEPLIFDDFEGNGNITTWFGDDCGMDNNFANPYIDLNNGSATVLEYNDIGGTYANVRFDADANFDLTVDNTFTLKIYVPSSGVTGSQTNQISLKLQDGTVGSPWETQTEIIKPIALDVWQEITFDFANDETAGAADPLLRTDFNRVVLQVNSEGNNDAVIAYIDDFSYGIATEMDTPPYATDDFEGNGTITTWLGDDCGMDNNFANPYIDINNGSDTVLEYNDIGGTYANIRFDVDPNFDLTAKSQFTLKIYVPSSGITGTQPNQISLKLQDGTVGSPWETQTEIIKTVVLDTWQEITFDFASDETAGAADPLSRLDFNRVVLQVNSEGNNDAVIAYIDDFNYHN